MDVLEIKVYPRTFGKTMNSDRMFMHHLKSKVNLQETYSPDDCNVFIAFVPIVSRAGTDIQAALQMIPKEHSYKSIILVSLHHTFDPHYIPPDSRYSVYRNDVVAVDCLYHEDHGLLKSSCNDEALKTIINHLQENKPPNQVVDNNKLIGWIFAVLSMFLVYLPGGYIRIIIIITESILLIIIAVHPNCVSYRHYSVWICTGTNIVLFFILYMS